MASQRFNCVSLSLTSPMDRYVGSAWVGVYVDGMTQQLPFTWPNLPVDRWMHLHLNAASPLVYNLVLMGAKDTSGGVVRRSPRITAQWCCQGASQAPKALNPSYHSLPPESLSGTGGAAQGGFCLHGLVGELYLWSAPLSHTEVAAIAVGFHPTYVTSAFLVAWYPLEEGEGDQLGDITRNLPDATLRGAPSWQYELPSDAGTTMFSTTSPRAASLTLSPLLQADR